MGKESKHVAKFRGEQLKPAENILATADGYIGEVMGKGSTAQHNGSLIITSERVAFYKKGMLGDVFESMPIPNIASIDRKSFLGIRTITLHSSHNGLSFKCMDKAADEALFQAIENIRDTQILGHASLQLNTELSPLEKLKELGQLKEIGVITEDEFQTKKAALLVLI